YIDHSVNMPRGVLEMRIHQHPAVLQHCDTLVALDALAEHEIYLICRSGGRSALAAVSLQNMGFPKVFSVAGGMQAWQDANFPMVQ
ncbi:rhodanese-like domain-containing protein, partial [Acinetobacter brisouii]|uniref:rhodanese-like domain-containing protein n=1 Tax=Acinetobacter brisouii TaxID=396323 RepID=UPI00224A7B74